MDLKQTFPPSAISFSTSREVASGSSTIVRLDEIGSIDRLSMDMLSDGSGESGGGDTLRQ